jgi:hypothetical protein
MPHLFRDSRQLGAGSSVCRCIASLLGEDGIAHKGTCAFGSVTFGLSVGQAVEEAKELVYPREFEN